MHTGTLQAARRVRLVRAALAILTATLLSACGQSPDLFADTPAPASEAAYDGPLYVSVPSAAPKPQRYGAAGMALQCTTDEGIEGASSSGAKYDDGGVADNPKDALRLASGESVFDGARSNFRLVREEKTRALFTYAVEGRTRQAIVVHDGPTIAESGWHIESWARCDLSEFPDEVTDQAGLQIWSDASGHRAPTTRLVSWQGPEHCQWQDMTFLEMGKATYVRAPSPDVREFFDAAYRSDIPLPANATDTGYHRDGRHLWLSPDKQRAYVGSPDHVEQWPRTIQQLGCA
ncbi:LptM family lipoprotein [Flexivirga sp. B27]